MRTIATDISVTLYVYDSAKRLNGSSFSLGIALLGPKEHCVIDVGSHCPTGGVRRGTLPALLR